MNNDLYNFHTRLPQQQQYQPPTTSSSPSSSSSSSSGPMVSVDNVTAVRSVKESIPVLTAPLGPQCRMLSSHGPPPLHGANARGVETVHRTPTTSVNNVNSVQLCRSFSPSNGLFLVPVNVILSSAHVTPASSRPQGVPGQTPLSSTCLVAITF